RLRPAVDREVASVSVHGLVAILRSALLLLAERAVAAVDLARAAVLSVRDTLVRAHFVAPADVARLGGHLIAPRRIVRRTVALHRDLPFPRMPHDLETAGLLPHEESGRDEHQREHDQTSRAEKGPPVA